jgi:hypothetical protein
MELASCDPSGVWNFEVASRFWENMCATDVNMCATDV